MPPCQGFELSKLKKRRIGRDEIDGGNDLAGEAGKIFFIFLRAPYRPISAVLRTLNRYSADVAEKASEAAYVSSVFNVKAFISLPARFGRRSSAGEYGPRSGAGRSRCFLRS